MKRFTKWTVIAAVALAIIVSTAGCTSNTGNNASPSPSVSPQPTQDPNFVPKNTSGYLTYSNRSAGYTIQYLPSWQLINSSTATGFHLLNTGTTGGDAANVGVIVSANLPKNMTLNDYSELVLPVLRNSTDFKLLSSSNSTLAGYPAKEYAFTFVNIYGTPAQGLEKLTLANHTGYFVSYLAVQSYYSANLEIAQNMIGSFNIVSSA
jgi:hypothetical protein